MHILKQQPYRTYKAPQTVHATSSAASWPQLTCTSGAILVVPRGVGLALMDLVPLVAALAAASTGWAPREARAGATAREEACLCDGMQEVFKYVIDCPSIACVSGTTLQVWLWACRVSVYGCHEPDLSSLTCNAILHYKYATRSPMAENCSCGSHERVTRDCWDQCHSVHLVQCASPMRNVHTTILW